MTMNNIQRICAVLIILIVSLLSLPLYAETLSGQAAFKPWSGHWWPLKSGELVFGYNGHPSPIEKYDLYTRGYYPADATRSAKKEWYDPDVPYWWGICHGWANAAILEHQVFRPSAAHQIFLNVGDKKGLLAAIHAEDETLHERCYNPEPFHRYLLNYIGEQTQAIAADLDSSDEFWSYPIYSYEMTIVRGTDADQVQCRIRHADDQGFPPDLEGTVEVEKSYSYKLDKDGAGHYIKGGGSWLGASVADHPQYVWVPVGRRPERLFIDYDVVKAMALSHDDEFQGSRIKPGHHLLMIQPAVPRIFNLSPEDGETIKFKVALDRQTVSGNHAHVILKRAGEIVIDQELDRYLYEIKVSGNSAGERYSLTLKPDQDNETGCSIHLYASFDAPFQHWFYGFPTSRYWLGNAASIESLGKIGIEVVGNKGLPYGEGKIAEVKSAEQLLTVLSTSTVTDYYSYGNQPLAVKVGSAEPLCGLTFVGDEMRFYGSTRSSANQNQMKELVIPWLTSRYNTRFRSELYLAQLDDQENQISLKYYKDDGTFYRQQNIQLTGEQVVRYDKGDYPDNISVNGWALVNAEKTGLDGAVLQSAGDYLKDQLPLLELAQEWVLPHPAVGSGWRTTLALYNPTDKDLAVTLSCHAEIPGLADYIVNLAPFTHLELDLNGSLWGISEEAINKAWLSLHAEAGFAGFMTYRFGGDSAASLPLLATRSEASRHLPQIASDSYWWTGMIFINRAGIEQNVKLTAYDVDGNKLEEVALKLDSREKFCDAVGALFSSETMAQGVGSLHLEQAENVSAMAIFGTMYGASRISAFCW